MTAALSPPQHDRQTQWADRFGWLLARFVFGTTIFALAWIGIVWSVGEESIAALWLPNALLT
ncbi:MAG: hypothetical protein EOP89_10210, partial [Lysobacteraceae bacterium]